jgi:hypothetical protein
METRLLVRRPLKAIRIYAGAPLTGERRWWHRGGIILRLPRAVPHALGTVDVERFERIRLLADISGIRCPPIVQEGVAELGAQGIDKF